VAFLVAASVVAVVFFIFNAISSRNANSNDRMSRILAQRPGSSMADLQPAAERSPKMEQMGDLLSKAQAFSGAFMPKTELEQNVLKLRLANAGFRSEKSVQIYMGIKAVAFFALTIIPGFIIIPMIYTSEAYKNVDAYDKFLETCKFMLPCVILGFFGPDLVLNYIKRGRQQAIFLSLPDALDLLVVCVESGLGLDAGMRRVCQEMKDHAKVICEEFEIANFQLQMGRPRRDVLHDLGVRTGVDDMRSLAAILIQADRFGSSVAQALRVQSDSMRIRRRQLAEEKAAKTAVQLLFPLVLFIFPGIFVVLVGPAGIQISKTPLLGGTPDQ
jgi:tight adherence protein C